MSSYLTVNYFKMENEKCFQVTGVFGHFEWSALFQFIRQFECDTAPYEVLKKSQAYKHMENCSVDMKITLYEVEPEYQYNSSDSPPYVLPGYYDVKEIEVTNVSDKIFEEEESQ